MEYQDKIIKYRDLIKKYNKIFIQKSKLDFELKKIKEKISEFEAMNLEIINELNKEHANVFDFILDIDSDIE